MLRRGQEPRRRIGLELPRLSKTRNGQPRLPAQPSGRLRAHLRRRLRKAVEENAHRSQPGGADALHRQEGVTQDPQSTQGDDDHRESEAGGQIGDRLRRSQRRLPSPYPFDDRVGKSRQHGSHSLCDFREVQLPRLPFGGDRRSRWTAKEKRVDFPKRDFRFRRFLEAKRIILGAGCNRLEADGLDAQAAPGTKQRRTEAGLADVGVCAGDKKVKPFFRLQRGNRAVSLLDHLGRWKKILLDEQTKRKKLWQISRTDIRTTLWESST